MLATSLTETLSIPTLTLDSTLQELPLHSFQVELDCPGRDIAQALDNNPFLPGVILVDQGQFVGMISRRRFFRYLSRQFGRELFMRRPVEILRRFINLVTETYPGDGLIVKAAHDVLQRPLEVLYEPIVVQLAPGDYRLLDLHNLLVAHANIHELTTNMLNQQTQARIIQTEKMASLGQMVAGVAHEILNPVNFICGNISYILAYTNDLIKLLELQDAELQNPSDVIQNFKDEIELEFLLKDLPQAIESMKVGAERLQKIVVGLKTFSHVDEANRRPANLHDCIENTLLILNNRLKYGIEVIRAYGELPPINCYSGQLSQVFMNILSNAIDALMEKAEKTPKSERWKPRIKITTRLLAAGSDGLPANHQKYARWVSVCIADNASGIPPEIRDRVFETFFTTKPMGKGTGLGLAISYQIVTEKHGGKLLLRSRTEADAGYSLNDVLNTKATTSQDGDASQLSADFGTGTEFEILLPLV
ncbi:MAG: ATP-binding protein [Cyanobacteria bacterium]|nr:ATP-binding protein [Cyanobacteriota bacterium]MDW8203213.1 ATP-binding protein [Cyanobacteriota bacterium SKYGB_h_bin112]